MRAKARKGARQRVEQYPPPNRIKDVERRRALKALAGFPRGARIELARVWGSPKGKLLTERGRAKTSRGVFTVSVPASTAFAAPPDIRAEAVRRTKLRRLLALRPAGDGHRPLHLPVHFKPSNLRKVAALEPRERGRRGGAIFAPDNRYIYQDAAFPWCTVGLIETENGWGSGTMIGRRLVLTASHVVVWKRNSAGWMKFTPGAFGGGSQFGNAWAQRVIYWKQNGNRMNDDETAFDYAVLVLDSNMGDLTGYAGYRTFSKNWVNGNYWQNLGYPGDIGGGTKPSFSGSGAISSTADFSSQSQTAYLLGNFIDYMAGQSGGPYWGWWGNEPWPRVIGTASTLPDRPGNSTSGDNEGGGGPALTALIDYARANYP